MNADWRTENPWAIDLAERRDERIVAAPPSERGSMTSLLIWTQTHLRSVAAAGVDAYGLVQMAGRPHAERILVCGEREGASFVRRDGVRCHFVIVVRERDDALDLISYVLHVDAPEGEGPCPRFLRWEYSPERKDGVDAVKEPLAHFHPGHDHIRIPSPVLSPKELIAVFLCLERWG